MLDIKLFRENPEKVKEAMQKRHMNLDKEVDRMVELDASIRALSSKGDDLRAKQNKVSKEIPRLKKEGQDISAILNEMNAIKEELQQGEKTLSALKEEQKQLIYEFPNVPHPSVPEGTDDSDNLEVRKFGQPTVFDFTPKAHWDLGKDLDILDPERAAKVSGSRFHYYKGLGAKLERSIISFFLDQHVENHGYTEMLPPFLVNRDSMTGTGQLPKFEDGSFKTTDDYFLIPTAEVPVTNYYRDEILDGTQLPIKYCAYSACFRSEVGSAGRDTRGLIRQHQFNKVELVKFASPETSYEELERLTNNAEHLLQLLELPYRVVALSTGDLGFSSAKTYDIEVWLPSYNRYVEISSCSNFEDFQARRASIRYKNNPKDKAQLVHTLNGSGLAVGRTTAAILENYQNADGSVSIPKALQPYMGTDIIK